MTPEEFLKSKLDNAVGALGIIELLKEYAEIYFKEKMKEISKVNIENIQNGP